MTDTSVKRNHCVKFRERSRPALVLWCPILFISCMTSAAQQAGEPQELPFKLQVNVNKIPVTVVVRDKQGRAVDGLKLEDFQVFDNDKPHPISAFTVLRRAATEVSPDSNTTGAQPPPAPASAASQSSTPTQRFILFLFDDMHLKPEEMAQAQRGAASVLDSSLSAKDIAAVVSLSGKTNTGLTRDRARLHDAIMNMQSRSLYKSDRAECPNIDYYEADLIENKRDSVATQDAVQKVLNCEASLDPTYQRNVAENEADSAARRALALGHQDVQSTYAAISAFVRTMATLPGDRLMILVSPGFLRIEQEMLNAESRLMDLAAESNVTISAVDARGLYTATLAASDRSPALGGPSLLQATDYGRSSMKLAEEPMAELAAATGGTFFQSRNDLGEGFKSLTEAPEVVYLLELSLDNVKPDGSFHRLKVKVDREGLLVQARHGYVIPKPEKTKK